MKNQELVTIYRSSAFGISKEEAKLIDVGTKDYAQYKNAPFAHYTPKGKKKSIGFVLTSYPYAIIIDGIGHPNPDSGFDMPKESNGLICNLSKYGSFDERYKTEFDEKINEYLKTQKIIMDVRHTVNTNLINK